MAGEILRGSVVRVVVYAYIRSSQKRGLWATSRHRGSSQQECQPADTFDTPHSPLPTKTPPLLSNEVCFNLLPLRVLPEQRSRSVLLDILRRASASARVRQHLTTQSLGPQCPSKFVPSRFQTLRATILFLDMPILSKLQMIWPRFAHGEFGAVPDCRARFHLWISLTKRWVTLDLAVTP